MNDEAVKFTEGLASFKAQHFHRQLAHDMAQGGAEELGTGGFDQLIIEGFIARFEIPQVIELAMEIGNADDLLRGHGGHHREAEAKRRDEPLAFGKFKLQAPVIEDGGIQDGWERVGHDGKVLGIHPTFLSLLEGFLALDGSCLKSPKFQELRKLKPSVDFLSTYV